MSDCKHSRFLSAYHDGELPSEECRRLEDHLRECPACARELERLKSLSRLFAAAPMPEMPADALERVHRRVAAARNGVVMRMAEVFTAAAAAVLVACVGWLWQVSRMSEAQAQPVEPWERTAITLRTELPAGAGTELQVVQWVVEDLSRENGDE